MSLHDHKQNDSQKSQGTALVTIAPEIQPEEIHTIAYEAEVEQKVNTHSLPAVTASLKAMRLISFPSIKASVYQDMRKSTSLRQWLVQDRWLLATILIACLSSVSATVFFFHKQQLLTYGDAYSHMLIARRVFDSLTPGLAQFGGVWLPLPHLLMLPFIWNNYLWFTGLAGSLVAMPCYLISATYLYLTAQRLTNNNLASFAGTLIFLLNPNILYLQATPLSELVLIATMSMACYHFLVWSQNDSARQLILAALGTFLATMSRYDGWFLFLILLTCLFIISRIKQHRWSKLEGNLLIFGIMGGLGIILWLLWCWIIFGDPLYWQRGPFSSQAQQMALLKDHILFTYHDLWQSMRYFALDASANVGPVLFMMGIVATILYYTRRKVTVEMIAASALLVPFFFYIISLYGGQAAIYVPDAVPATAPNSLYNARYGVQAVPPIAIFLATAIDRLFWIRWSRTMQLVFFNRQKLIQGLLVTVFSACIVVQAVWTVNTGIISLQSGQYGLECSPQHATIDYLTLHYDGGKILENTFTSPTPMLDFKNVIYEGSNIFWQQALAHPETTVNWVLVNPDNKNDLANQVHPESPWFQSHFHLTVKEKNGLSLYRRNDLPPVPTHTLPPGILIDHHICGTGGPSRH